jgi:hypothetical protein
MNYEWTRHRLGKVRGSERDMKDSLQKERRYLGVQVFGFRPA